jgi:hypothetical protein
MKTRSRLFYLGAALGITAACGGGTPVPTTPSAPQSFLAGTWSGTLTIQREDAPTTSGSTMWTFDVVPGTNLQTYQVTIRSQHPWLMMTTTVTSAITPSNTPPARVSTQGDYPSPRGCTGSLLSVGTADASRIDADFSGVDCQTLQHSTFRGSVTLTKTGA